MVLELGSGLSIRVEAAFHDDPPPSGPVGRRDRLWEHEVVECFLVGPDDRGLEIEFGPHGHWLGLRLRGPRQIVDSNVPVEFEAWREARAWRGLARIEARWLPTGPWRGNAFAIHGPAHARRYLAATPVPGEEPDFHRFDRYPLLPRGFGARDESD